MRDDAVLRHALPLGRGLGRQDLMMDALTIIPPSHYLFIYLFIYLFNMNSYMKYMIKLKNNNNNNNNNKKVSILQTHMLQSLNSTYITFLTVPNNHISVLNSLTDVWLTANLNVILVQHVQTQTVFLTRVLSSDTEFSASQPWHSILSSDLTEHINNSFKAAAFSNSNSNRYTCIGPHEPWKLFKSEMENSGGVDYGSNA